MPLLTHVITGFLGAGKTTLISALLANKPSTERWAVLVNEFGQIGIDQAAWSGAGVMIKEVPGGCICCTQNMPMQLALGQIVSLANADRLLIEPTGLGHPAQILATLREPHWQAQLHLGATVCLVDARQLSDERVLKHDIFKSQVEVADVLLFSKADVLSEQQRQQAMDFAASLKPSKALVAFAHSDAIDLAWLDVQPQAPREQRRSLLHPPAAPVVGGLQWPGLLPAESIEQHVSASSVQAPPYHYVTQALEHEVGGWIFPAAWQFQHDPLLTVLIAMQLAGATRVKGVFNTDKGWIFFNATAQDLAIRSSEYRADNRVELISAEALDWAAHEQNLLTTLTSAPASEQKH